MSGRTMARVRVYAVGLVGVSLLALALSLASPLRVRAQAVPADAGPPALFVGAQGQYALPVGEFRDYVRHGGGLGGHLVWPVQPASPLALRADGGFLIYGSETRRVCFSGTVGCRVQLDLTTTNSIAYGNVGPQLMVPTGAVRPYVNGAVGFSYFSTTSSVDGSNNDETIASTTNFRDFTFAWGGGGGLLIRLSDGVTPVLLDISARYHGNGEVEYLKRGDITDHPDGSITISPTRSDANLVTFQLGISVGLRPGA